MKRFLRWFLNFLERKFPDKVVVTEEKFEKIYQSLVATNESVIKLQSRMDAVEINVRSMNQAMGFQAPKMGMLER